MYSKVKDFLTDDDFINYALGVVPQSASKWEAYFKEQMLPVILQWLKAKN